MTRVGTRVGRETIKFQDSTGRKVFGAMLHIPGQLGPRMARRKTFTSATEALGYRARVMERYWGLVDLSPGDFAIVWSGLGLRDRLRFLLTGRLAIKGTVFPKIERGVFEVVPGEPRFD